MMEPGNPGNPCAAPDARLAALLDEELDPADRQDLEGHLRVCRRCQADLARQRLAREVLRRTAVTLTPPPELRTLVRSGLQGATHRSSKRWFLVLGGVAAALILFVIGALLLIPRPLDAVQLARAVDAHMHETLSGAPVSFASSDPAAVSEWSRAQIGRDMDVPSLAAAGYQLLGVRLEPAVGSQAVTLVYEGPAGRLSCTILPPSIQARLGLPVVHPSAHATQFRGVSVASWAAQDGSYVMIAETEPSVLLHLAQSVEDAGS